MRIKIINPNTTWSMTEKIGACARAVAHAGTEIVAVSPAMGPVSIESHYDEALAVPGLLQEIAAGERDGIDGYVIACFGDPGLKAARELARGLQARVAEAGDHVAVDAVALAGRDLLQQAGHGQRLVVVALDGDRAHGRAHGHDLGAGVRHRAGAGTDLLGHAPGGVGVDDLDAHGALPFSCSVFRSWRCGSAARRSRSPAPCR